MIQQHNSPTHIPATRIVVCRNQRPYTRISYDVPIPPLAEQVRIVTILDKFDTLTNSITEGLPREIELRQKQYEYYRDMLFSFPKPDVVEA